jgi:hypothetical protein
LVGTRVCHSYDHDDGTDVELTGLGKDKPGRCVFG